MLHRTNALLNGSTAKFKVPSTTSVAAHVDAINILVTELKAIDTKFKEDTAEIEEAIGQHIKAIKIAEADNWESVVKAKCGLSRSRAYELMAIADGTKTVEQVRYETNVRKIRHRQIKSSVPGTDKAATDAEVIELKAVHRRELTDARARLDEREAVHERQLTRCKNEIAQLSDARNLGSERDQLRRALDEIVELLAEMRGLMTHSKRNQTTVITKITRAEKIATAVLRPAKVAVVNLPVTQVA